MPYKYNKRRRKRNPEKRKAERAKNYLKGRQHDFRSGLPWSQAHSARIIAPDRPTDRELASEIGRSVEAIQAQRHKLLHHESATGGLNGSLKRSNVRRAKAVDLPQALREPTKPPSLVAVRLRALSMGLKPPADLSAEVIQEWIHRYEPAHSAGVVVGLELELGAFGRCKIVAIHPATNQVTASILKTGKQRFVSLQDVQAASNRARVAARRGGR